MKIQLKQIRIQNFKGIQNLSVQFGQITNIKADNAKGKSTVFDAFCWVLFNKDSHNNSKFYVRPIDKDGKDIDYIDITVELSLLADGKEIVIKKTQKQKWPKIKGSEERTFQGNVNEYEWNEIPKSEKEYSSLIEGLIDDNEAFMIVTNPAFFPNRGWKDQRYILMQLVSDITDDDVIMTDTRFESELKPLLEENTIDELKAKYAKATKEWNKQIDAIPGRIDEVSRNIKEVDYSSEEIKLKDLKEQMHAVEEQIEDTAKGFEEITRLNQEIFNLKSQIQKLENDAKKEYDKGLQDLKNEKYEYDNEFNNLFLRDGTIKRNILSAKGQIEIDLKELEATRAQFKEIESEEMKEGDLCCPTCGQSLPKDKIATISEDFNQSKTNRLLSIREKGINFNKSITELTQEVKNLEAEQQEVIAKKTSAVGRINSAIKKIDEYPKLDMTIIPERDNLELQCKELEFKLYGFEDEKELTASLKLKKNEIQGKIDEVNRVLNGKENIENAKKRVIELQQEHRNLAQKVVAYEKKIFLFEEFEKAKMNMLSAAINSKFKLVNWKLFSIQINGGFNPCCECTVDGVPYSELNSAMKVSAGLDIINTVSSIYNVQAPIFIDNREGINDIPEVDSQIINLIVISKPIMADTEIIL